MRLTFHTIRKNTFIVINYKQSKFNFKKLIIFAP